MSEGARVTVPAFSSTAGFVGAAFPLLAAQAAGLFVQRQVV